MGHNTSTQVGLSRGFTLVEMMIVLVIMAILTALAGPSFRSLIEDQRAKAAASDIYMSLMRARSEAMKRNANVTVSPVSGNWVNGWQIADPALTTTLLEDHGSLSNLTVTGPTSVVYQSSGRIQAGTSATFTISGIYTSAKRCVYIDLGGRPAVKTC